MADKKRGKAAAAGLAGVVIGAGIAVAATKVLQDEKSRKKVVKRLNDVKKQLTDTAKQLKSSTNKKTNGQSAKTKTTSPTRLVKKTATRKAATPVKKA